MFSQPLRSVAPALFARIQHDRAVLGRDFLRVLRVLTAVAVPACVGLAVSSGVIVRVVYGSVWSPAAGVLTVLGILAIFRIVFELVYDFLVVVGRSSRILSIQVVGVAVLVPALLLATERWGLRGAAASLVFVAVGVTTPLYLVELSRLGVRAAAVARAVWPGVAAGAVTVFVATAAGALPIGGITGLAATVVAGIAAAGAAVWWSRADLAVWRRA
jgi:PST family polysaccharide transporter